MAKLAVPGHCILPCGQKSSPVHTASSRWSCSAPGTAPIVLTAERTPQPPSGRQARSARQCQQVGTDPHATVAVARLIYGHLPKGGTSLWVGISNVGKGDPPRFGPRWPMRAGRPDLSGSSRLQTLTRI
jgi:hypothetical protein